MNCTPSLTCWKFIIAAIVSLATLSFACTLLIIDRFQNTALTSFCTSLVCSNLFFWVKPPDMKKKPNELDLSAG